MEPPYPHSGDISFPDFLELQKLPQPNRVLVRWRRGLQSFCRSVDLREVGTTVQAIFEQGVSAPDPLHPERS